LRLYMGSCHYRKFITLEGMFPQNLGRPTDNVIS
jgi:hypothetical protein